MPPSSSFDSIAREARAQSSTVTFSPSVRSMRTSRIGRLLVPLEWSSKSSSPSGSSSLVTTFSSASLMFFRASFTKQKNVGDTPTFSTPTDHRETQRNLADITIESILLVCGHGGYAGGTAALKNPSDNHA